MGSSPTPGILNTYMGVYKKVNADFFKTWSPEMSYLLGYIAADGCITIRKDRKKNPHVFNITSIDRDHLYRLRRILNSAHKISQKSNGHGTSTAYQLSISNKTMTDSLIQLGITPRKTHTLQYIRVPDEYFADFVRGFFDGDGSVYLYVVNGVSQIKSSFVSASLPFIKEFNWRLCERLSVPLKSVHQDERRREGRVIQYSICFYVSDSERLERFMYYKDCLCLPRKYEIFKGWESITRRKYTKAHYPSKVGWRLSEGHSYI